MEIFVVTLIALVIITAVYFMMCENRFVSLEELVKNAWSNIDVVQENRYDTLIELYKIVVSYAEHERNTLNEIVRNRGLKSNEETINNLVANVYAVAEAYPELKADTIYNNLVEKLTELNAQTKFAKLVYNDAITKFNRLVKMFPSSFVASMFKHEEKEYLTVDAQKKQMPNFDSIRDGKW
ncbi:LemA family protein [Peptostreptococcaceae bacterium AS15]|nr:LemA family protein [Peptostreptococcaceae bacterium AS15]